MLQEIKTSKLAVIKSFVVLLGYEIRYFVHFIFVWVEFVYGKGVVKFLGFTEWRPRRA
jgi:hypothetical protein